MAGMVLKCHRCGHDLPALDDDEQTAFLAGGSRAVAEHAPGQCPHELAAATAVATAAPVRRRFHASLVFREVVDRDATNDSERFGEPLGVFAAEVDAPTPGAAMDVDSGLAGAIGEKWSQLAQLIDLSDIPPAPPGG